MEIKKSYKADLESQRPLWFLLGLAFALALMYSALEFTSSNSDEAADDELLDEMQDIEMMPALDRKDMVAAVEPSAGRSSAEKMKAVDKSTSKIEQLNQINNLRAVGSGASLAGNAADNVNMSTALPPVAIDNNDNPLNFRVVEQLPEFPGGMVELMKWLQANLKYPDIAKRQNIQGRVVVAIIINKDGTIANPKIMKSAHPLLDREAMRIVRMMPKWKPGIENDKPCRTMFAIPINFKI